MTAKSAARAVVAAILVGLTIAGAVVGGQLSRQHSRTMVAGYFPTSTGLFPGDDVRVLGVPVGKVDRIEPMPDHVKIWFWVDEKYPVPADVKAVILSPQLVTGRAIQLTPAYTGGPTLSAGAEIPESRTAVPVEWDDIRDQLERINALLAPTRPGGVSALGEFINTAAANLRGQGPSIRDTIVKLSQTVSVLSDHSDDIFATFKNLSVLVSALRDSADLLERLNENLADLAAGRRPDQGEPNAHQPQRCHRRPADIRIRERRGPGNDGRQAGVEHDHVGRQHRRRRAGAARRADHAAELQ